MTEVSFKAKLEILATTVDVKPGRIIFTPSRMESLDDKAVKVPATFNFQIDGLRPVELTDEEEDYFWKFARTVAGRSELKEIEAVNETIVSSK
jgi:hypothetical protein